MIPVRIAGLILLVAGIVFLVLGVQATDSLLERFSDMFTGRWTDRTNFFIIGGAMGIVAGMLLAFTGGVRALKTEYDY